MKYIKKFESFVNDTNRDIQDAAYPELNPATKQSASEYVDKKLGCNEYLEIFNAIGMEDPGKKPGKEMDEAFDKARELGIKHFTENPEQMDSSGNVDYKPYKVGSSDGVSRTTNVGGNVQTQTAGGQGVGMNNR